MTNEPHRRIRRIRVEKLFGLYTHDIPLNEKERVTILHGPNGVGKTTILRLVHGLLSGDVGTFPATPFQRVQIELSDGLIASVDRAVEGKIAEAVPLFRWHAASGTSGEVPLYIWTYSGSEAYEVISEAVGSILAGVRTLFVETQRLRWSNPHRSNSKTTLTVEAYSGMLAQRLMDTLTRYGKISQQLDQSYPRRLVMGDTHELPATELQDRLARLEERRSFLRDLGLLATTDAAPLAPGEIKPADLRPMTLYILDSEEKLRVFDELAERVQLMVTWLNRHFIHKRVRVTSKSGLEVTGEDGQPLPLGVLSSGEQHQIVLLYDLLFRVPPDTLLLIDEPELSLHVAWQEQFVPQLLEIAKLVGFDALLATHSPYILGDRMELEVALSSAIAP